MLRVTLALIALSPLARCDDDHYHDGRDYHYGPDSSDYTEHHYGDGESPSHGDEAYEDNHNHPHYGDYGDYGDHHYNYAHHDYGAGDPSNYMTHGSLLLDDPESLHEFLSMDLLETAVVCVLPPETDLNDLSVDAHPEFEAYRSLAQDYSHLFRFGHSTSPAVAKELELTGLRAGESAVVVQPAALLAANHPRAGGWLRFPGKRVAQNPLTTFLFMEATPLVGQYEWRSLERASVVHLPAVTVFAPMADELRHTYHDQDAEQHDEHMGGAAAAGEGEEGEAEGAGAHKGFAETGEWTFDALSAALRPVGLAHRHQLNLLVADKRRHSYDLHAYNLPLPGDEEDNSHTVGLGIVLDDVHYARTVQLPGPKNHSDKDPGEVLAQAVSDFVEMFFDGLLKPEKTH